MVTGFRKRIVSILALLALLVTLVFATLHLCHCYESNHEASTCTLCVFQHSVGSTVLPSAGLPVLVQLAMAIITCFIVRAYVLSRAVTCYPTRAPPLA